MLDETGAFTNEISNTVIEITGEAAAAFHPYFWILIVVIIAVVVIMVAVLVTRSRRVRGGKNNSIHQGIQKRKNRLYTGIFTSSGISVSQFLAGGSGNIRLQEITAG